MNDNCITGAEQCENNSWVNLGVGCGLSAVATINIMSICKTKRKVKADLKEEEKRKMMEE